jgi:hypothetical protein
MDARGQERDYTHGKATRFFVPLFFQACSQCLTYPLVAAIVSHGAHGVAALPAFAQGQTIMFLIGSFGGGLITTGMVFARTRAGYRRFIRFNAWMMAVLLAVQAVFCCQPFADLVFRGLLNLPADLAGIARGTLLWSLPVHAIFFVRNIPLVVLFNARASATANNATLIRILLTAAASGLFVHLGWTGVKWGLVAMTGPCLVELLLAWLFARPHARRLAAGCETDSPLREQFAFTIPLSLGGFLLAAAPLIVASFIARTEQAVATLALHYVTIGIANAVSFGALRTQAVAIQFPPEYPRDARVLTFSIAAGLTLGALMAATALPSIAHSYFRDLQNIPPTDIPKAQITMLLFCLWPLLQAVRGHAEGLAALKKKTPAILAGQLVHLGVLVAVLSCARPLRLPDWLMGVTAILCATAATTATILTRFRSRCPLPSGLGAV